MILAEEVMSIFYPARAKFLPHRYVKFFTRSYAERRPICQVFVPGSISLWLVFDPGNKLSFSPGRWDKNVCRTFEEQKVCTQTRSLIRQTFLPDVPGEKSLRADSLSDPANVFARTFLEKKVCARPQEFSLE